MFCALAGSCLFLLTPSSLLINELLYDPPGPDSGHEFVEILCSGDEACSLEEVWLQFVNGSDIGRPRNLWSAGELGELAAGERLLLGEEEVRAAAIQVELGLQNGPDALRLWRGDVLLDAVAWGDVEGLGEGLPAEDVSAIALARVPDGTDRDDNSQDFRGRAPTPGQPNSFDDALEFVHAEASPAWLARAGSLSVETLVRFVGDRVRQEVQLQVTLDGKSVGKELLRGAAGEERIVERSFVLGAGAHLLELFSHAAAGHRDSLVLALQVGPTVLTLSELLPAPRAPEPEWIELRTTGPAGGWWSIADLGASPRKFELSTFTGQTDFILLSQDCPALRMIRNLPDSLECLELDGGWISLNNHAGESGAPADRVRLYDARGAVVDEFAYGAESDVVEGRGYERSSASGVWLPSPAEPTPGLPNTVEAARLPSSGLAVSPELFTPDGDGSGDVLHIVLRSSERLRRIEAEIVDLRGESVRQMGPGISDADFVRWSWNGRDGRDREIPWGAYVVVIHAQSPDGEPRRWRSLFALGLRP